MGIPQSTSGAVAAGGRFARRAAAGIAVAAASAGALAGPRPAWAADTVALDAFIARALTGYQVPGAAVAVVRDGEVVLQKGYGVRNATRPEPVDERTVFQLASATKMLTAIAAATVADQGALDWDMPITRYVPEFAGYDPYMTRWLTMRDLLAHRTGWPAFEGNFLDEFGYSRAEAVHRLRYLEPRYSLREVAQYSNVGLFLAGEVAARVAGVSWNELVERRVFAPLGMTRSGTSVRDLADSNATATHALRDGRIELVEPNAPTAMAASGGATSTAADMAQVLKMLLAGGRYGGTQVLRPATVAEIYKRSMVGELTIAEVLPTDESTGMFYGLGVDSFDYAGHHIINKAGALSGVRTVVTLIPDLRVGIVVLANLNVTAFPEAVRAFFLNQAIGLDPMTDQPEILKANQQLQGLFAPPGPPERPGPFPWPLRAVVGTYENAYYGRCTVSLDGETLGVAFGPAGYRATLRHRANGMFWMQFPGATSGLIDTTFTIGADGTADSMTTDSFGTLTRVRPSGAL